MPAWTNTPPWLLTLPGYISETTTLNLIKFSEFHRNQTRFRVRFLSPRPACLFSEIRDVIFRGIKDSGYYNAHPMDRLLSKSHMWYKSKKSFGSFGAGIPLSLQLHVIPALKQPHELLWFYPTAMSSCCIILQLTTLGNSITRVCQVLSRWMKNSLHSFNIWYCHKSVTIVFSIPGAILWV